MDYKVVEADEAVKSGEGYGQTIIGDKCDSHWTDEECPIPATCAEYHYGQFGHKVLFLFCDSCRLKVLERRKQLIFFTDEAEYRGFEPYNESNVPE